MLTKTRTACGNKKVLTLFYIDRRAKCGRTSECKSCVCLRVKRWDSANPGKAKRRSAEWYAKNRENVLLASRDKYRRDPEKFIAIAKEWRRKNPAEYLKIRRKKLLQTYGLSLDAYSARLQRQRGLCACCGDPPSGKHRFLCVDHNHTTGAVRDLLCPACNTLLGFARESPVRLSRAIEYLKRHASIEGVHDESTS